MSVLSLAGGCLAYGDASLLENANLEIEARERVALIGRNGSGKSSLLAALAGDRPLDDGDIRQAPGLRIGYVPQEPSLEDDLTVFESVVTGMGNISGLVNEYHSVSSRLALPGARTDELLEQLHAAQAQLEAADAWTYVSQAERAVQQFHLDPDSLVATLSGGQQKRLALARALARAPDVLLLDEPTNHLDIDSIAWLEELLLESSVALLFISHDRRLLDRLATRVLELDRGQLTSFDCGYSEYRIRKERMLADEAVLNRKADKLLREEEVWIRKGIEARRTRSVSRIARLEQLRAARAQRRERMGQVRLQLAKGDASGQMVVELEGVGKSYGDNKVVSSLSCRILRGDKVGIVGPNGAGKTTLLKLLLGELHPDTGSVRRGTRLQVAYFDQFRAALDPEAALVEIISPGSDYVEIGHEKKHVIGYLGEFLFPPQRARSPVKSLSGGERNRLLLARLFARPANVLVLDEPTNDLDIDTLELLEELLQNYGGTLFLVSHDRTFLDNVVTQVIASDGGGEWLENAGGFTDWLEYQRNRPTSTPVRSSGSGKTNAKTKSYKTVEVVDSTPPGRTRPMKLGYREQQELAALPERIGALENEQADLTRRVEDPALYADNPEEARRLATRLAAIDDELNALLERWEELDSRSANAG